MSLLAQTTRPAGTVAVRRQGDWWVIGNETKQRRRLIITVYSVHCTGTEIGVDNAVLSAVTSGDSVTALMS